MTNLDIIKREYVRYAEQFRYLADRIRGLRVYRDFSELTSFCRMIERREQQFRHMAERGLDQIHAVTKPDEARVLRYKNMLKFLNAFYVLWCESYIIQYDGYLCVPPYTPDPHENYPFGLHPVENEEFNKRMTEALENPMLISREIRRFRARLRDGFRTYGEENVKKCEERLESFRARLPIGL